MAATMGGVPGFPAWRGASGRPGVGWRRAVRPRSGRIAHCGVTRPGRPVTVRRHPARSSATVAPPAGHLSAPVVARPVGGSPAAMTARGRRRVRLTRRGRLVLLILVVCMAVLAGVGVASASRAADPPGEPPTAVVRPGDTLWSVVERHGPGSDPFGAIEEIRRLNGLRDYTVHPGQELILPDPSVDRQ